MPVLKLNYQILINIESNLQFYIAISAITCLFIYFFYICFFVLYLSSHLSTRPGTCFSGKVNASILFLTSIKVLIGFPRVVCLTYSTNYCAAERQIIVRGFAANYLVLGKLILQENAKIQASARKLLKFSNILLYEYVVGLYLHILKPKVSLPFIRAKF